ncbi:trypsin-like peptidase domain-containing protein [Paraburkholderia azotifigens]|uniref:Trypsin-like peptidase domain-containing protein n=1 Tax=Paraburkholderia azotifigens TaxID=2057004 RepID=A0ABU9RDV2_9BURK
MAQSDNIFDDELVLKFFQNLVVLSNDLPELARKIYEDAAKGSQEAPTLDDLIDEGWVECGWRCMSVPFDVARSAIDRNADRLVPFVAWLNVRHNSQYEFRTLPDADDKLTALVKSVVDQGFPPSHIACITPTWVAARRWDRDERHHAGDPDFLFEWLRVWESLNYPKLVPSEAWGEDARNHFITSALAVLENDAKPLSWDDYRLRGILQTARARQVDRAQAASWFPDIPAAFASKAEWLVDKQMEPLRFENGAWSHAANLVSLLLAEVEYTDNAPTPHPIASRLLNLALKHPEVLSTMLFWVEQRPALLADMTLKPETAALACLLISKWRVTAGVWDRRLMVRDNELSRAEAFNDALSVLCQHAKSGQLASPEVAALLHGLHATASQPDDMGVLSSPMLVAFRSRLVEFSSEFLISMYDALLSGDYDTEVGLPAFSAALDVVNAGQLVSDVSCSSLVTAYIRSIREDNYRLSTTRISTETAAVLFDMSQRLDEANQRAFLYPLDIANRLSSISPDENHYIVKDNLVRALRAHLRVLARAIIGQRDEIPSGLVDALVEAVYSGAFANFERGRVEAFAVRFERHPTGGASDSGLALDFGRVLSRLVEADGTRLLKEILLIDEPAFLAQLSRLAPPAMRPQIQERIKDLIPRRAGTARYLTDFQFRIDELLAAGEYAAAKAYMEAMPEPRQPLAGQFAVVQLRHRLQFALSTHDWKTLEGINVPPEIPQVNKDAARDTITFYRAVAQFSKEGGNIQMAEQVFAQLHGRHRSVPEYGFNLFAAKLARLIENEPFPRLQGQQLVRAKTLLAEAEQMEAAYDLAKPNADSYLTNKAILLLVIGYTGQAEKVLRDLFRTQMTDRVAAYLSVALARLGRTRDALSTLDEAEESLGTSDVVRVARAHVAEGHQAPGLSIQLADSDSLDVVDLERAVYRISCKDDDAMKYSEGSGFLMNGFGIVTCDHVVQRLREEHETEPQGYFGVNGGKIFLQDRLMQDVCELEIIWSSEIPDIALLRPKGSLPEKSWHLDLSEQTIETGAPVQLYGFPNHSAGKTLSRYATSIVNQYNYKTFMHYEIAQNIRKGNSGGPVVDEANRLIGIAKEGSTQGGGNNAVVSITEVSKLHSSFSVTPWAPH